MTLLLKRAILILIVTLTTSFSYASHRTGTWFTYENISLDSTRIEFNIIRNCYYAAPNLTMPITVYTCGDSIPTIGNLTNTYNVPNGYPYSYSECGGGVKYSSTIITYTLNIATPVGCDSLNLSWGTCCAPSVTNYLGNIAWNYSKRFISPNSSAHFTGPFNYYFDADTTVTHTIGLGAFDADGDSLVYTLMNPPTSYTTTMIPASPFTISNPCPWIVLDSVTGEMQVTSPGIGVYLAYINVKDYDINGNLKGETGRTITFQFNNDTTNTDVEPTLTSVNNILGASYNNQIFTTNLGDTSICFDMVFTDTNLLDTILLSTNITEALPGAVITTTGINPINVNVCWNYSASTGTHHHFKTTLRDRDSLSTDFNEPYEKEFLIKLWGTLPSLSYDSIQICQGDSVQFDAGEADSISWSVISGEPMLIGTNFSCLNCSTPTASPSITTTYQMWGQMQGYTTLDTVTIVAHNVMIATGLPSISSICEGDSVQLNTSPGTTPVSWLSLGNDTLAAGQNISCLDCENPMVFPADSITLEFTFNPNGLCEMRDTTQIYVTHMPTSLLPSTMNSLCETDTVTFSINHPGTYNWNAISGSPIITGTNINCDTCNTIWASPDSNSVWSVTNTNGPNCSVSDTISFIHNYIAPSGLQNSILMCENDSFTISSQANGYIQWSYINSLALNGINISNTLGASTTIFPSSSDQLVCYNSVATGCSTTDTINITVQALQNNLISPVVETICVGDDLAISSSANASVQWVALSGDNVTIGQNFDCDTCSNVIASPSQNTTYQITNTYFTGCFETDSIQVFVNDSAMIFGSISALAPNIQTPFILVDATIQLFSFDNTSGWVLENTTHTDTNGYYYFFTLSDSVKVACLPDATQYGIHPVMYHGNTLNLSQATVTPSEFCGTEDISMVYTFSTNVSVAEIELSPIVIFPNPNTGTFTISVEQEANYEIYGINGTLVYSGKLHRGDNQISINVESGTYFIHVNEKTAKQIVPLIIK